MLDARVATIEALRSRIAALGGGGGPRREAPPRPRSTTDRAAELGFATEPTRFGEVFVRRVPVDMLPWHEACAMPAAASVAEIVSLVGNPSEEAGPVWSSDEGVGVLDIESLGLHGSGVVAFLVAAGVLRGTVLEAEQYLLADPAGETAMLAAIGSHIGRHRVWLTYNGRSFDVPVMAARCIVNRLDPSSVQPRVHGDLLGPVRRLFRDRLGACTLRHAEMSLLNHHRVDDVPGAEAPARYRAWLRGAPAATLQGVVAHNLQDIVSTVLVGARLAGHVSGRRVDPAHAGDSYHLARHLERRGLAGAAEIELRSTVAAGIDPWARHAAHRLARLLQRRGETAEALETWRALHETDHRDIRAARGYAIRLERRGDVGAAVEVCRRVRRVRDELGPWWPRVCAGGKAGEAEWERRELRLRRRLEP